MLQTAHEGEKKIPQMLELTFHVALLRYSDQVVRRICNFQSFIHNPPRFCSSPDNNY